MIVTTIKRSTLLACTVPDCGTHEMAEQMFNRPIPASANVTNELIKKNLICPSCAPAIRANGETVYRLEATMRTLTARAEAEEVFAKRRARLAEDVKAYAKRLLDAPVYSTGGEFILPKSARLGDGYVCGIPLNCCDHRLTAPRFLLIGGEVVGICSLAAGAIVALDRERGGVTKDDRLFVHPTAQAAEIYASKRNRDVGGPRRANGTHLMNKASK